MVTKMKHAGETRAVVQAMNEKIAKFTQLRDLLADAGMLAIVKEIVQNPASTVRTARHSPNAATRSYGGIVGAAFEVVEEMGDEPFTKWGMAKKLGTKGYEIKNPKSGLFYAFDRLLAARIINLIEEGVGNRPNLYQRAKSGGREEKSRIERNETDEIGTSGPVLPKQPRCRDEMERIALDCIAHLSQPFATHELISDMRAAGFTFIDNADLSIQPLLQKLLNRGILEIQEGTGQRAIYKRRNGIPKNAAQRV